MRFCVQGSVGDSTIQGKPFEELARAGNAIDPPKNTHSLVIIALRIYFTSGVVLHTYSIAFVHPDWDGNK